MSSCERFAFKCWIIFLRVLQELCLGTLRKTRVYLKISVGSSAFGMHHAFRGPLPVEMCQLPDQVTILNEDRAPLPGCKGVLVVSNRDSLVCGKSCLRH